MPEIDESELNAETVPDELPPSSEEGYRICIDVSPNGYAVSQSPLPQTPLEDADQLTDLTKVLKTVLGIIKANPLSHNAHDQLKAGFGA